MGGGRAGSDFYRTCAFLLIEGSKEYWVVDRYVPTWLHTLSTHLLVQNKLIKAHSVYFFMINTPQAGTRYHPNPAWDM